MPMGVWSVSPRQQKASWAFKLGSGAQESPDAAQGFRNSGPKGPAGLEDSTIRDAPPSTRKVREEESQTPLARGTLRNQWVAYLVNANKLSDNKKNNSYLRCDLHSTHSRSKSFAGHLSLSLLTTWWYQFFLPPSY